MQEKEIELSLLRKGEFSLRSPYKHLEVNSTQWIRMTEKQKQQALQKIHITSVDDTTGTRESRVTAAVLNESEPILHQFLQAAVDWIPREVLGFKTKKVTEIHSSGSIVLHSPQYSMLWVWKSIKVVWFNQRSSSRSCYRFFYDRQYRHRGEVHTRAGHVYFHCATTCVRYKQPAFDLRCHCTVPHEILRMLTPTHINYLQQYLGLCL